MNIIIDGTTDNQADDEQFCPDCFAGIESSEHHEKCVAPLDQLDVNMYFRSRKNKVHRDGGQPGLACGANVRDMGVVAKPGPGADLCAKCFRPGGGA